MAFDFISLVYREDDDLHAGEALSNAGITSELFTESRTDPVPGLSFSQLPLHCLWFHHKHNPARSKAARISLPSAIRILFDVQEPAPVSSSICCRMS